VRNGTAYETKLRLSEAPERMVARGR